MRPTLDDSAWWPLRWQSTDDSDDVFYATPQSLVIYDFTREPGLVRVFGYAYQVQDTATDFVEGANSLLEVRAMLLSLLAS